MAMPYEPHAGGTLTARERQVCELAARAWTNKEIAVELHLAEQTVKNKLGIAFQKLGVSTRMELARLWMEREQQAAIAAPARYRSTVPVAPAPLYARPWDWEGVAA